MILRRQLREVVLGRGDYAAGGACTRPFLEQDGARRRRPMVFGEVFGAASECDELAASMFSGRASDPCEWAVMWKEIGADGICLRTGGLNAAEASEISRRISDRTCLPLAVSGDPEILDEVAAAVTDTILVLMGAPCNPGEHVVAYPVREKDDTGSIAVSDRRMLLVTGMFPDNSPLILMKQLRESALNGDDRCDSPVIYDATPVWDMGFDDARGASMVEGEAALTAMLAGADAIIVRGPGAADMARVYGEELADL